MQLEQLSPDQWSQLNTLKETEQSRRSLQEFTKQAYKILEPATEYKDNIVSQAISAHLEAVSKRQITKLLISCGPQFGKSNLTSVCWPMHDWIDNPHRRFLCTSFKMTLAGHFSEESNKIFKSQWYQDHFAKRNGLYLTKDTIDYFENSKGGSRRCSAFESCTGFGVAGGVLIVDDSMPVSVSDDMRLQYLDLFLKGLSNRPGATGSIVILGQRVHTEDLIGVLQQMGNDYENLVLPNEFDPKRSKVTSIGWKDPRDTGNPKEDEGKLIWPEVFTKAKTEHQKKYGRLFYEGQYNQLPVKQGGNIFSAADFRSYTTEMLPKEFDRSIIVLDCTFNDTKTSDFVVAQVWSAAGANFYLRDEIRDKLDFTGTAKMFAALCYSWPGTARYVEEGANGFAIISALKNRIPGIVAVKVKNESKVSRYHSVAPIVAAGNVWLPKHADWLDEFLLEAEGVPNCTHDDQMDAMAMALRKLENAVPMKDIFGSYTLL